MRNSNFHDRFMELVTEHGDRQVDVVHKTGIPKGTISRYFSNEREPMQDALYKISQAYNVDVAWLMGYDVSKRSDSVIEIEQYLNDMDERQKQLVLLYVKALLNKDS